MVLPDYLKEEYPEAIHLVFGGYSENLMLGEAGFVTLSFGDGYEDLGIPFDAIEGLVCQEEGFALQLPSLTDYDDDEDDDGAADADANADADAEAGTGDDGDAGEDASDAAEAAPGDNVVTLDAFRKEASLGRSGRRGRRHARHPSFFVQSCLRIGLGHPPRQRVRPTAPACGHGADLIVLARPAHGRDRPQRQIRLGKDLSRTRGENGLKGQTVTRDMAQTLQHQDAINPCEPTDPT